MTTTPSSTPIEGQENEEHFFEVVPEGSQDSIENFIKSLEGDFEYPAFTHLSTTKTDEEIAAEVLAEQEEPDEEEDDETTPPTPPITGEVTPPVPPVEPTLLPDHVMVNGNQVALADIQRLYEFDQFLRSNPEAAQRVTEAVTPSVPAAPSTGTEPPAPPASQELTPPDFLDLEDPAQKFMWESHVANQKQIELFNQRETLRIQQEADRQAQSDMASALTVWKAAHPNFNEDQITLVRKHAAEMNVIGAIMATTNDPVAALARAMDIAAMDDPDLRTVYLDPETHKTPTRQQRSETRKGKLNALGGSSGSVPRTTPTSRPMSDREAIDQFAKELGESFQNQ